VFLNRLSRTADFYTSQPIRHSSRIKSHAGGDAKRWDPASLRQLVDRQLRHAKEPREILRGQRVVGLLDLIGDRHTSLEAEHLVLSAGSTRDTGVQPFVRLLKLERCHVVGNSHWTHSACISSFFDVTFQSARQVTLGLRAIDGYRTGGPSCPSLWHCRSTVGATSSSGSRK
jgi:hypothetical protein